MASDVHSSTFAASESSPSDDADLVSRVRDGDRSALADLYDRHAPHVYTLAKRVLRSDADAEAVVSDVFLELWRKPNRFDESRGTCGTYLRVLARSRAVDRLRAETTRSERTAEAADESVGQMQSRQASEDPSDKVIRQEASVTVRQAVEKLDPNQREPLFLAYFEGLTHSQIAERLDRPLGTVKTRIRAGLQALQFALRSVGRSDDDLS